MVAVSVAQQALVRVAARALSRAGLAHAYGHCSQRIDRSHFLVCAARPMGLIRPAEDGVIVPIDGPLPQGVLGEVSIHQQIYLRRTEIGGVCRTMPASVMALSVLGLTPKPRHGMGAYFSPEVPLWDDVQLVRSEAQAIGVSELLGSAPAVVMRGNGAVTVGADIRDAVVLNWYLEDCARIELEVLRAGTAGGVINEEDASSRATRAGRIFERMWEYLTAGDVELELLESGA